MSFSAHRIRRKNSQQTGFKTSVAALTVLGIGFACALVAALVLAVTITTWLKGLPDYNKKGAFDVAQPTTIYSADGKLLARLYLENREVVDVDKMSPLLLNAVVAVEDERFYQHNGVDFVGILRAALATANGTREGASTITQQYVRQTILLDEANEISLKRKVREAYLAMQVEKRYSKKEILGLYLNAVYFGEGAYGAQAASKEYFAKDASKLTLSQAALIAGLPQQPSRLDPYKNLEGAIARRDQVLRRMLSNGYISQLEFQEALDSKVKLKRANNPTNGIYSSHYFVSEVKRQLQNKFSMGTVFGGGLIVYTTLDSKLQGYAESAVRSGIGDKGPEGALVSIDPKTGYVKAVVGGRNYAKNKFNMATQAHRQPGSSFKTFTLVTALDKGMSPYFMVDSSSPAKIPTKPTPWIVSNSEGRGRGMMSLSSATVGSVNTVFARVAWEIGAKNIVKTANKLGIKTPLKPYPSIALGAQNVTPLEMSSAYATLANGGLYNEPTFITKVANKDKQVIFRHKSKPKRVLDADIAYATTQVLRGVVSSGTGTRARLGLQPVAGKTGTSQENRDVWFAGYTPQLSTAVWVGWPTERTIIIRGSRAFGGTVCAPIWHDYTVAALKGRPVQQFKVAPRPDYDNSKFHIPVTKVENTKGSTLKEARAKLKGFKIVVKEVFSDKPAGTVLGQKISGSTATLTVSKGPDPDAMDIPPSIEPTTTVL